ncbi:alpha/beta fold hydrolase [Paenibacillus nasutitermitis]|uniref:Alpha/beta hydrolase n=1 Tax=Paenibacillus nasutitermitis TaxID=1652958 RepID=A0A917DRY2_9BACL|nr:alpha/beta hydrolase [Paenibacillus nasutitermitis]GGD60966.1 alpha/beta hydrolase [Paenibacillus nasutitermitis]
MVNNKQLQFEWQKPTAHLVTGGGGVKLHVEESGNAHGQPLLFIHGGSQSHLCWNKQLYSELASDFRLVTMDLRGHGLSEKPKDGYGEAQLWADDIHAIIQELNLMQPILVGWSFAGIPILDYIRVYGEKDIGGIYFVGAITRLGREASMVDLGSATLQFSTSFFSNEPMIRVHALDQWLKQCVHHKELSQEEHYFFLGCNVIVPAYVHQGIFTRQVTNDDLLASLTKPVLVAQGMHDRTVNLGVGQRIAEITPSSRLSLYEEAGHAVFWDQPERFNHELREFINSISLN